MPSIFKALSTITAWVLFVFGLLRLVIGLVMAFTTGPQTASLPIYLDFFVGVLALTLSVVVMLLRKKLE
jgi:hypothetical protein